MEIENKLYGYSEIINMIQCNYGAKIKHQLADGLLNNKDYKFDNIKHILNLIDIIEYVPLHREVIVSIIKLFLEQTNIISNDNLIKIVENIPELKVLIQEILFTNNNLTALIGKFDSDDIIRYVAKRVAKPFSLFKYNDYIGVNYIFNDIVVDYNINTFILYKNFSNDVFKIVIPEYTYLAKLNVKSFKKEMKRLNKELTK